MSSGFPASGEFFRTWKSKGKIPIGEREKELKRKTNTQAECVIGPRTRAKRYITMPDPLPRDRY